MTTRLTKEYVAAMGVVDAIESKMIVLAKHQLEMDHNAYSEVFGKPRWEYPPSQRHLELRVDHDSGRICIFVCYEFDEQVGEFDLQIDDVDADNSVVYGDMIKKYQNKKSREDAADLKYREERRQKLLSELDNLDKP